MFIYDVLHKEKVYQSVAADLRNFGVKYRLKKNAKAEKPERANLPRKLFKTALSHLPLDVVNLSSGAIVHVPSFVSEAIVFLQQYLTQEGLFRKAGSQLRQRELMSRVDNGGSLGEKNNPIDIANCLKTFFRQLPEPLIPYSYHDLFIRCGMMKTARIQALLLACILLPPHHLNTLAFLMEFLKNVSSYEKQNRMSIDNLAKVFVPSIMPLQETTMVAMQARLEAHLTIIKTLIEHSEKIGILPSNIAESISNEITGSTDFELNGSDNLAKYKKKKHRSGSLTRMLSGLKKIVGKNSLSETGTINEADAVEDTLNTPLVKLGKKRRVGESTEVLAGPKKDKSPLKFIKPRKDMSLKTNVKVQITEKDKCKKLRLSLDRFTHRGRQKAVETETEKCKEVVQTPYIERRWSSASSSCKAKKKHSILQNDSASLESLLNENISMKPRILVYDDGLVDARINLSGSSFEQIFISGQAEEMKKVRSARLQKRSRSMLLMESYKKCNASKQTLVSELLYDRSVKRTKSMDSALPRHTSRDSDKEDSSEEYVKIPKSEYEDIKNRVSAIETRISQEFSTIVRDDDILTVDCMTNVQNEYQKTLEGSSIESTSSTDQLARRMSKELKIRRSIEHKIFRSPSARKIGSIRRRSQEKIPRKRVSRTASWHSSERPSPRTTPLNIVYQEPLMTFVKPVPVYNNSVNISSTQTISSCSNETNARLDFLQEQLHTLINQTVEHTQSSLSDDDLSFDDDVFDSDKILSTVLHQTPSHDPHYCNNKTMSGSQSRLVGSSGNRTDTEIWTSGSRYFGSKKQSPYTPTPLTGRASIAKLRTQNAGMVLAKAKLFDETSAKLSHPAEDSQSERRFVRQQELQRRQSIKYQPRVKTPESILSPSNGKRIGQCKSRLTSPKNSGVKSRSPQTPNQAAKRASSSRQNSGDSEGKSGTCQKENEDSKTPHSYANAQADPVLHETDVHVHNPDVDGSKTPHIKKQLLMKTPRSAKLVRRPAVEIRKTPMKAVPILTPKRPSPAFKSRHPK